MRLLLLVLVAFFGCVEDVVQRDGDDVDGPPMASPDIRTLDGAAPDLASPSDISVSDARVPDAAGPDALAPDAGPDVEPGLADVRARFPWNGMRAPNRARNTPVLIWDAVPGASHYEVRMDASCTDIADCDFPQPILFDSQTNRASPFVRLPVHSPAPVGTRYFWGVRACQRSPGELVCSAWSATRYLYVGRAAGDYNGDGFSDLVVGAPSFEREDGGLAAFFVYEGSPEGLGRDPVLRIEPPCVENAHRWNAANAGDINGDGFGDLLTFGSVLGSVGSGVGSLSDTRAYIHFGSLEGLSATPSVVIEDRPGCRIAGGAGIGDVDGDGFSDIALITSTPEGCSEGRDVGEPVLVYHGRADGVVPGAPLPIDGPFSSFGRGFTKTASGVGDVDGDGFTDVVIGVADWNFPRPAMVYLGGPNGLGAEAAYTLEPSEALDGRFTFPYRAPFVGDVHGDGFADIVAVTHQFQAEDPAGAIHVFDGGRDGPPRRPSATLRNFAEYPLFGSLVSGGDFDGSDTGDLAIDKGSFDRGRAADVYFANDAGDGLVLNPQALSNETVALSSPGDFDGDGLDDLAVGVRRPDRTELVLLYRGAASGLMRDGLLVDPSPPLAPGRTSDFGRFLVDGGF